MEPCRSSVRNAVAVACPVSASFGRCDLRNCTSNPDLSSKPASDRRVK